jgi:hypothetical protein
MSLSGCSSESVMMRGMVIDMEEARLYTLAQVKAFLNGTAEGAFRVPKAERHRFIEHVARGLAMRNMGGSTVSCCSALSSAGPGWHAGR